MRSLQSSEERAYGIVIYRSQSRAFAIGSSYFSRASYIMQTYRSTPRTAPHLLWKVNCV